MIVAASCPTFCDPMDCSPPGYSLSMGFSRQEHWVMKRMGALLQTPPGLCLSKQLSMLGAGFSLQEHLAKWEHEIQCMPSMCGSPHPGRGCHCESHRPCCGLGSDPRGSSQPGSLQPQPLGCSSPVLSAFLHPPDSSLQLLSCSVSFLHPQLPHPYSMFFSHFWCNFIFYFFL